MSLSKADKFYLEAHRDKKSEDELSKDLGKSIKSIRAYLKKLAEIPVKPKTHFQESKGTIAMTAAQSTIGDESRKTTNEAFYAERKNCIHVIDPELPMR